MTTKSVKRNLFLNNFLGQSCLLHFLSWRYFDPSPARLDYITRPMGDSEAASWRHPSDKEGLPSPGGPVDRCGSQDGLPWDHHARLSVLKTFPSIARFIVCQPLLWYANSLKWMKLVLYEGFFTCFCPLKVTYETTSTWLWFRGILTRGVRQLPKTLRWPCLFMTRTAKNSRYDWNANLLL